MKLVTKAVRRQLPSLYSTEQEKDPLAMAKFFTPWTNWTWYAVEFDGEDTFWGLANGHDKELGYFSLLELLSVRGPGGLTVERDLNFEPTPVSKLKAADAPS